MAAAPAPRSADPRAPRPAATAAPGRRRPEGCPLVPAGLGGRRPAGGAAGAAARCEACGKAPYLAPPAAPRPCPRGVLGTRRGRGRAPAPPHGQTRPAGRGGAGRGTRRDANSPAAASAAVRGRALPQPAGGSSAAVARRHLTLHCSPGPFVVPIFGKKSGGLPLQQRSSGVGRGAWPPRCSLVLVPVRRGCSSCQLAGKRFQQRSRCGPGKDAAGHVAAQTPAATGGAWVGWERTQCPPKPKWSLPGLNLRATTMALDKP